MIFERPIKVGDRVQTADYFGIVTGIGIRASTIRTFDGAEVVVPNGDLVAKEFVNWTRTDRTRRAEVLVRVALGTDPKEVLSILQRVASEQDKVLENPEPTALMTGFGESSLDFRLLVWTRIEDYMSVASDLHVEVNDGLKRRHPHPDPTTRSSRTCGRQRKGRGCCGGTDEELSAEKKSSYEDTVPLQWRRVP